MSSMFENPLSGPEDPRSRSDASAQRSTRPLLEKSVSSSSCGRDRKTDNVARQRFGTAFYSAEKSEGRFNPEAHSVAQRQINQRPFEFESTIKASIIHFHNILKNRTYFVRGEPSIQELVFESNPAAYMASLDSVKASVGPDLRWIHLPANNMSWVQAVVSRIYAEEVQPQSQNTQFVAPLLSSRSEEESVAVGPVTISTGLPSSASGEPDKPSLLLRPELWEARQWTNEATPSSVQGRFLRPLYSKVATDVRWVDDQERLFLDRESTRNCVLFMPYIHWERVASYSLRNRCLTWMALGGKAETKVGPTTNAAQSHQARRRAVLPKKPPVQASVPWKRQQVEEMAKSPEFHDLSNHAKLLLAYVHADLPLHVRRTLDQSYYYTLKDENIRKRDLDQVLFRYTYHTLRHGVASRILMVDQLWLWIIDEPGQPQTILTAFPPRWEDDADLARSDLTDVYNRVFRALMSREVDISSAADLVCLIIDKCSSLFHPAVNEADLGMDYLEVFTVAIAALADAQTRQSITIKTCSDRLVALQARKDRVSGASLKDWVFRASSRGSTSQRKQSVKSESVVSNQQASNTSKQEAKATDENGQRMQAWFEEVHEQEIAPPDALADLAPLLQSWTTPQLDHEIEKEMNALIDVRAENESLAEIKDILDELNSITHIYKQQIKLLEDIVTEPPPPSLYFSNGPADKYTPLLKTTQRRADDFENLTTEATRVYNAICDILNLKQKQAAVLEAFSSRQDAKETARQGQIILIFTIVTIIFLPLSFVAAVFSMNAVEINGLGNRSLGDVWKIMYPTMGGVLTLSLIIAFHSYVGWLTIGTIGVGTRLLKMVWSMRRPPSSAEVDEAPDLLARSSTAQSGAHLTTPRSPGTDAAGGKTEEKGEEKEDPELYGAQYLAVNPARQGTEESRTLDASQELERPSSLYRSGNEFFYESPPAPRGFLARHRRNRDDAV